MVNRVKGCGATESMKRKDAFLGAGLTLGSALAVAAIMVIGNGPLTETIGLVMFPGVLGVGTISLRLRGHSTLAKVVLVGGPFLVLFVIGLLAGLVQNA